MGQWGLLAAIGTAFAAIRATFTSLLGNEAAAERSETMWGCLLAGTLLNWNKLRIAGWWLWATWTHMDIVCYSACRCVWCKDTVDGRRSRRWRLTRQSSIHDLSFALRRLAVEDLVGIASANDTSHQWTLLFFCSTLFFLWDCCWLCSRSRWQVLGVTVHTKRADNIPVDPDYILLAEVDLHSPAEDILHHSWREGRHVTVSMVLQSYIPIPLSAAHAVWSEKAKPLALHSTVSNQVGHDGRANDERVYEPLLRVLWSLICIIALVRHDCGSPWREKLEEWGIQNRRKKNEEWRYRSGQDK